MPSRSSRPHPCPLVAAPWAWTTLPPTGSPCTPTEQPRPHQNEARLFSVQPSHADMGETTDRLSFGRRASLGPSPHERSPGPPHGLEQTNSAAILAAFGIGTQRTQTAKRRHEPRGRHSVTRASTVKGLHGTARENCRLGRRRCDTRAYLSVPTGWLNAGRGLQTAYLLNRSLRLRY